jgi:hypothetical protein
VLPLNHCLLGAHAECIESVHATGLSRRAEESGIVCTQKFSNLKSKIFCRKLEL